jgi:hypothetical protein
MRRAPLAVLAAGLAAVAAFAADDGGRDFRFARLNRTYEDVATGFAPIEMDPLKVTITSPHQTVIVREHKLRLVPQADGSFLGTLDLDFLGKGQLEADLDLGSVTKHLSDLVVVPPQHETVAGRVRIVKVDGGYKVTTVELPAKLGVGIESRLANDVISLCDTASFMALGSLDCGGLERSLTRPEIPLPGPGQDFFLAAAELDDAERAAFDAFLAGGSPPTGGH